MHASVGETAPLARDGQPRGVHVMRCNVMRHIDDVRVGQRGEEHTLDLRDVTVCSAKIGEDGDDRPHCHNLAHAVARFHRPPAQIAAIASARPMAVIEMTHQIPVVPHRAAAHTASGMRAAVIAVDVTIGATV